MTPSFGTRRQLIAFVILLGAFLAIFIRWRSAPEKPGVVAAGRSIPGSGVAAAAEEDRPAPKAAGRRTDKVASPQDVPFLSKSDFDPPRSRPDGAAPRNIFDPKAPTPIPPPTPTPGPPPPPAPGSFVFIGPLPAPPPTPTPAPPEITFKFIGTFGPKDHPVAVLVLGDQLVDAHAGQVVFDQFEVRRVGYESIDVGFVRFPSYATKRVAIAP